mgnify:CR=1 FL=1
MLPNAVRYQLRYTPIGYYAGVRLHAFCGDMVIIAQNAKNCQAKRRAWLRGATSVFCAAFGVSAGVWRRWIAVDSRMNSV